MNSILKHEIYEKILEYNTIIINTHKNPDLDALGSQAGLFLALKKAFPKKFIYAVGEFGKFKKYEKYFSNVKISEYKNALIITTDSGALELIGDKNYSLGSFHIKIDHHINTSPYGDICYVDESAISACQIIYMFLESWQIKINTQIAETLMEGLISDSGRFLYQSVNSETFYVASKLMEYNIYLYEIYKQMYVEDINFKRYKGYVLQNFKITPNKVAYMKNYQEDVDRSKLTPFAVSRGMVNSMSNLDEIEIWVNFTENNNMISAELRSKKIPVNTVAADFGGGGHKLAAGAAFKNWDEADKMINALEDLILSTKL